MSKSLGNVLDPFEVMDQFGTDALRYYCFREVSFGLDGNVSTTTFGERYTSELANEYGNLASRTLNMIGRYCDGAVPDGRRRPRAARRLRRPRRRGRRAARPRRDHPGARPHLGARAAAQPLRRGEGAVEAGEGPGARGRARRPTLRSLAEGLRVLTVLLSPYMPESTAKLLAALGDERTRARARRRSARRPAAPRSASSRRCSRSRSDRLAHPSRPRPRARGRAGGRGARRRASTGSSRSGWTRRAAARRSPPRSASTRCSPRSAATRTAPRASTTPRPPSSPSSPQHAALPRDRRDRARLLPRPRAARGPGARVPRPDRARARGRQAARHPHARGGGRHVDTLATRAAGRRGGHALLLDARPARRVPRARLVDLVRGQRDLPEVDRARARPPSASRSTACSSRPTRRT